MAIKIRMRRKKQDAEISEEGGMNGTERQVEEESRKERGKKRKGERRGGEGRGGQALTE